MLGPAKFGILFASGGCLVLAANYVWHRVRNRESAKITSATDQHSIPQALADVFSPIPEVPDEASKGCCRNESEIACSCRQESQASSISSGKRNLGLPKKEYLALKKAGMLPTPNVEEAPKVNVEGREITILYATQSGNAESFAKDLFEDACEKGFKASCHDLASFDVAQEVKTPGKRPAMIFLISTWTGGCPPAGAQPFFDWLNSLATGDNAPFNGVRFAVYALGNSLYADNFCKAGRLLDEKLEQLGGSRMFERFEDDESDLKEGFGKWKDLLWMSFGARVLGNSVQFIDEASNSEDSDMSSGSASEGEDFADPHSDEKLLDVEDLGKAYSANGKPSIPSDRVGITPKPKKMLNTALEKSLTKQGYKIVGSHSGVKLCRWTKSMLRGRGGCYKHTFYGIASYQCMEATPSLACANKCVFCWRHHKNPVGTSWRWETDDARMLVDGFIAKHRGMIKEMRGLPGVNPARLEEAQTVRHCALSLVGEPILYPEINRFLQMLHGEGISSFLVTNAQFPDQMESLVPCTQLYVSIDASNAAELKVIDRPLFSDFWERFLACIDALARKRQRTVFRLTLVKGFNMAEAQGYAELIRRGRPDFVEVKGVTFTGGKRPELGMRNVPWHAEVVAFTEHLCSLLPDEYGVASEHAHSCAVLMAHRRFCRPPAAGGAPVWHTWIDFSRFLQLAAAGAPFGSEDYMAPTPDWAVFRHPAALPGDGGFDPAERRFRKHRPEGV